MFLGALWYRVFLLEQGGDSRWHLARLSMASCTVLLLQLRQLQPWLWDMPDRTKLACSEAKVTWQLLSPEGRAEQPRDMAQISHLPCSSAGQQSRLTLVYDLT